MANAFTQEAFSLLGIGVLFVVLRLTSRVSIVGIRGLWPDDYLMILATIVYALETATAYIVGAWYRGLANNGMTNEYRAELSPSSEEYHFRVNGSKTQLVGWSLYSLLLWLLKMCMCIFFHRLTQGMDKMRWRVRAAFLIVGSTYIATICSILFGCHPFRQNWQIYPDPGRHCQPAISHIDLYVTLILNVLSDLYLLSIPVTLFWQADIGWPKRLSMIALFSGGIFVMAAACLRCALIIQDPVGGAQAAGSWAVRETFVAVVVTNLPIVYQGYHKKIYPTLVNRSRSSRSDIESHTKSTRHSDPPIHLPSLNLDNKDKHLPQSWDLTSRDHNTLDTYSQSECSNVTEETTPARFA